MRLTTGEIRLTISKSSPYLVLRAEPFVSEDAARAYLPSLWGGLAWMAVQAGTVFAAEMEIGKIVFAEDPEEAAVNLSKSLGLQNKGPVHGMGNGNQPSIVPIGKNILLSIPGSATVSQTFTKDWIEGPLTESLRAPGVPSVYDNERTEKPQSSCFCDAHRERSLRSKFLTLVMALEVLSEPTKKHEVAQQLLDDLEGAIAKRRTSFENDSDEWHALDALKRELCFRRETSLRSRIRQLVLNGFPNVVDWKPGNTGLGKWVSAYDVRSELVHDGTVPKTKLTRAHSVARSIVRDLLEARMQIIFWEQRRRSAAELDCGLHH